MNKWFQYNLAKLEIKDPNSLKFENTFYEDIYGYLFSQLPSNHPNLPNPIIDFDDFYNGTVPIDIVKLVKDNKIKTNAVNKKNDAIAIQKELIGKAMLAFLTKYPFFFSFLKNVNANAVVEIKCAEWLLRKKLDSKSFIELKVVIDHFNGVRWSRDKNLSERQAGVSILGGISENLLAGAFASFIDETNFFKVSTSSVQSYGDFVLMCLPNNLWMSVKSNFARERLLASGYTTDIVGAGFFTDSTEFTSGSKIRNFQKVGFLAMYLPDIPITEDQIKNCTSTFIEIETYYKRADTPHFPYNINGKPFIRKLSSLSSDMLNLLSEKDIRRRVTIGF